MQQKYHRYDFWRAAWWKQDPERGRWALSLSLTAVLLVAAALVTPGLLDRDQPAPAQIPAPAAAAASGNQTIVEPGEEQPAPAEIPAGPGEALPVLAQPEQTPPAQEGGAEDGKAPQPEPDLVMPVTGGLVTRPYGYDYNPNTEDYRFHRGCDIRASLDQPVLSAAAGQVSEAYTDDYWGGVVRVEHGGGWATIYKCLTPVVKSGDRVEAGAQLGAVTRAPAEAVQDNHLHLEVENHGESVNPELFLSGVE